MIYQPTIVKSEIDFKAAVVKQQSIIVLENENFFWKIEAAEKKALQTRKTAKTGGNLLMLGGTAAAGGAVIAGLAFSTFFPPAILFGGIAAAVTGGSAKMLGNAAANGFQKQYQEYFCVFDYDSRFAYFVKAIGESKIEKNDRPWIDVSNVYPQVPEKIELRLPDGTLVPSRMENGILKLFVQ